MTDDEAAWPEYMSPLEVAGILHVSKMSVYRLIHRGALTAVRVGRNLRVTTADLRSYLEEAKVA